MTIGLLSFSGRGYALEKRIVAELQRAPMDYCMERGNGGGPLTIIPVVKCGFLGAMEEKESITRVEDAGEWLEQTVPRADALIFIGACGIAVRYMAGFLKDKKTDPAVIVIDECGHYCIPILSGHLGGANALSAGLSSFLGAENVITTATDLNQVFAVDLFALKNQLSITDMQLAKRVSAALLAGKKVFFHCEGRTCGKLPAGLQIASEGEGIGICVALRSREVPPFTETLLLRPQVVVLGIGCKKDTPFEKIQETVREVMEKQNLTMDTVKGIASIELKKEEKGILDFCQRHKKPFFVFSAKQLREAEGYFQPSAFVESVTGVDNVCERSAVLASKNGRLLQQKYAKNGVTVAIAVSDWGITFE